MPILINVLIELKRQVSSIRMIILKGEGDVTVIYLTAFYMFLVAVFVSAIGGFLIYKVSHKFLNAKAISQILGVVVSLFLSYLIALMIFEGVWFFSLPMAVMVIVIYIAFLLFSNGNSVLIKWVGIVVLTLFIAVHVYLITMTILLN